MKKGIHPKYQKTSVTCVNCNEVFEAGSTAQDIRVEVCSKCHPYYTGKETYTQAAGRVERFKQRYGIDEEQKAAKETKAKTTKKVEEAPVEEAVLDEDVESSETPTN